ncbi:unnamed protein product, partial [marine sediment metagenome]
KWFYVIEFAVHKDGYNFHVHVVFQGRYIDQNLLSKEWLRITGNSYIAHIQLVKNTKRALDDITKYLCKPFKGITLARWVAVLKGNRLFSASRNCLTMKEQRFREIEEYMSGTSEQTPLNLLHRRANSSLRCQYCGKALVPMGSITHEHDETGEIPPPDPIKQRELKGFD